MNYKYYIDRKITSWYRENYTVEASSQEEADKLMIAANEGSIPMPDINYIHSLDDSNQNMTVEENEGFGVTEIYREADDQQIYNDGKLPSEINY
jgi:hypothetical protein